jgi:C4-dicarboxylate-specific signal transduction histidine kinase
MNLEEKNKTIQWEIIAEEGFHFFGKMSASISHEIKNALAIINNKAGLLEDFTVLAGQGRPIDPERVKSLAGDIMKQILRADGLVNHMNRFAHSADDPLKMIDVGESLELITSIAGRLASGREARVDLILPDHPVMMVTNPFLFENLIWSCLEFLLTENHKTIKIIPESIGEDIRIRVIGQFPFPDASGRPFPSGKEEALLTALKVELHMEPKSGELLLVQPKNN